MTSAPTRMELPDTLSVAEDFSAVSFNEWRALAEKDLKGAPFAKKLITHTYEGIDRMPVYTPGDGKTLDAADPAGLPGLGARTRGADPLGASVCGWDICQEHADPDLLSSRREILEDLERGVTSLLLRYDAAGRDGLDPDDPGIGELPGQDGLMIYRLEDLDALLDGVHLNMVGLNFEAGMSAPTAAGQLKALLERRGIEPAQARGAINFDPLAVLARRGQLPCSMDEANALLADLASWTQGHLPRFRSVRVGTGPYHHAGATAAQDLGYAMATGLSYLRAMTSRGLSIDQAAGQLLFNFNLGTNFFLATAKLRAARGLWARVLKQCGADDAHLSMLIHARPSKRVLTQRDPWVNMLRGTVTTFAASIGGAQIITCEPFDKAIGLPNAFSRRIARNTQLILAEESNLGRVVDPGGGSWMLESLTAELAEMGWACMQSVEQAGGMAQALTDGVIHRQIDSAFGARLKNIARRKDAVTGVSEFPNLGEAKVESRQADVPALCSQAKEKLAKHRDAHDANDALAAVHEAWHRQRKDVKANGSVTEAIAKASLAGATLGSIADELFRRADPIEIPAIAPHPYAQPFEELRDASDEYHALTGHRPKVLLVTLGPVAKHTARATYARNFFEAGGFEAVATEPILGDPETMANLATRALLDQERAIVCVCSADAIYEQAVDEVAKALKRSGCPSVILAGFPGEKEGDYRAAGVDRFIYMKCDVLGTLRGLLTELGVLDEESVVNA